VIPLVIPPLRERRGDILFLTRFFISKYCRLLERPVLDLSAAAARLLLDHTWPGNVRELENAVEYAVNLATGPAITPEDLPPYLRAKAKPVLKKAGGSEAAGAVAAAGLPRGTLDELLSAYERDILSRYLAVYGTSAEAKAKIASELGISLATLYRHLGKYRDLSGRTKPAEGYSQTCEG
jgi:DNA-binding NtrC family response regulator